MPTQTSQNLSSEFLSELFKGQAKRPYGKMDRVFFIELNGIQCPVVQNLMARTLDTLIETHTFHKEDQVGTLPRLRKK